MDPNEGFFWGRYETDSRFVGPFDSVEDALADAAATVSDVQGGVYIGKGKLSDPADLLRIDDILERLDEFDDCSPLEDSWTSFWGVNKEQCQELEKDFRSAFRDWASRHKLPRWYTITGISLKIFPFNPTPEPVPCLKKQNPFAMHCKCEKCMNALAESAIERPSKEGEPK